MICLELYNPDILVYIILLLFSLFPFFLTNALHSNIPLKKLPFSNWVLIQTNGMSRTCNDQICYCFEGNQYTQGTSSVTGNDMPTCIVTFFLIFQLFMLLGLTKCLWSYCLFMILLNWIKLQDNIVENPLLICFVE